MTDYEKQLKEDNFRFDDKEHLYFITVDGEEKALTGTTTILGMIGKGDNLMQWAADVAAAHGIAAESQPEVLERYLALQALEGPEKKEGKAKLDKDYPAFKLARTAHLKRKKGAADVGKQVHKAIEEWIKGEVHTPLEGVGIQMFENFKGWTGKHNIEFLESEKPVYSKKYWTAGTYDFKFKLDGKVYLGDLKTTSAIYDRIPFAQCAAYQMMEEEMTGLKEIEGRMIINIRKDGTFDENRDVYVSEHYADDLLLFLSALEIYRNMNSFTI